VKAATGEIITAEELGGADTHGRRSGVVDHVAEDDEHALTIVRRIVANLNTTKTHALTLAEPEPPAFDPEELYGVVPTDVRAPYDVREVIARVVDGSRFRRVQGALWDHAGLRLRADLGLSGWRSWPTTGCCSPRAR